MWKLGQLKPNETFYLFSVSLESAVNQIRVVDQYMSAVEATICEKITSGSASFGSLIRAETSLYAAILKTVPFYPETSLRPAVTYRQAPTGSSSFSLETTAVSNRSNLILTRQIGSITIEYNPLKISQTQLLTLVHHVESNISATVDNTIPYLEFKLPLVMGHPDIQQ
ncbi:hypothetical protein BDV12DRAFT_204805 [Aspergillus spectabilis]